MTLVLFRYVYADATNAKTHGAIALSGVPKDTSRGIRTIADACDSGELFIPEQVGLPPLQPCLDDGKANPTGDDLIWHRFESIAASQGEMPLMTLSYRTLVRRFRAVPVWDIRKSLVGRAQLAS